MHALPFAICLSAVLSAVSLAKADDAALCSAIVEKVNADVQSLKELSVAYDQHRHFAADSRGDESEYRFAVSSMELTAATFETTVLGIRDLIEEAHLLGCPDTHALDAVTAATEAEIKSFSSQHQSP